MSLKSALAALLLWLAIHATPQRASAQINVNVVCSSASRCSIQYLNTTSSPVAGVTLRLYNDVQTVTGVAPGLPNGIPGVTTSAADPVRLASINFFNPVPGSPSPTAVNNGEYWTINLGTVPASLSANASYDVFYRSIRGAASVPIRVEAFVGTTSVATSMATVTPSASPSSVNSSYPYAANSAYTVAPGRPFFYVQGLLSPSSVVEREVEYRIELPYWNGSAWVADSAFNPASHQSVISLSGFEAEAVQTPWVTTQEPALVFHDRIPVGTTPDGMGVLRGAANGGQRIRFDPARNTLYVRIGSTVSERTNTQYEYLEQAAHSAYVKSSINPAIDAFLNRAVPYRVCRTGLGLTESCSSFSIAFNASAELAPLIDSYAIGCRIGASSGQRCGPEATPLIPGDRFTSFADIYPRHFNAGEYNLYAQLPGSSSGTLTDIVSGTIRFAPFFSSGSIADMRREFPGIYPTGAELYVSNTPPDYTGTTTTTRITEADLPTSAPAPTWTLVGAFDANGTAPALTGLPFPVADITQIRVRFPSYPTPYGNAAHHYYQSALRLTFDQTVPLAVSDTINGTTYNETDYANAAAGQKFANTVGAVSAIDSLAYEVSASLRIAGGAQYFVGCNGTCAPTGEAWTADGGAGYGSTTVNNSVGVHFGLSYLGSTDYVIPAGNPAEMCFDVPLSLADFSTGATALGPPRRVMLGSTLLPSSQYSYSFTPAMGSTTISGRYCVRVTSGTMNASANYLSALVDTVIVPGVSPFTIRGEARAFGTIPGGGTGYLSDASGTRQLAYTGRSQIITANDAPPGANYFIPGEEVCLTQSIRSDAYTASGAIDPLGAQVGTTNVVGYFWVPRVTETQPGGLTTNTGTSIFARASSADTRQIWVHTSNTPTRPNASGLAGAGWVRCGPVGGPCDAAALTTAGVAATAVRWVAIEVGNALITDAEPRGVRPRPGVARVSNPYTAQICLTAGTVLGVDLAPFWEVASSELITVAAESDLIPIRACRNSATGAGPDVGCMSPTPACDESGMNPVCVVCTDDTGAVDGGCSASTPMCSIMGMTRMCVSCITAADCSDGNVCTTDACTGGRCSNTSMMLGATCPGGVCNGAAMAPICEACIDSGTATDLGCSAASPHCIGASGMRMCVACTTAAHCNDSNACTTDACTATGACTNTAIAAGSPGMCATGLVCSGAPSNTCVDCIDSSSSGTDAGCATGAPHCRTSGTGAPVCEACINTVATGTDLGCSSTLPNCVVGSGGANVCVACTTTAECNDGNACTVDACSASGTCTNVAVPAGMPGTCASGLVCSGAPSNTCVTCQDTAAGTGTDLGCSMTAPICVGSGTSTARCQPCQNSTTSGTDLGCMASAPACETGSSGANICLPCEDSATGTSLDNGCSATTPMCVTGTSGARSCVQCTLDSHCALGTVCGASNTCVPGCDMDDDCEGTPETPVCDIPERTCVPCNTTADCDGTEVCNDHVCEQPDTDNDGIHDDVDLDDENDGIPDTSELPDGLSEDGDDDGILDFQDPSSMPSGFDCRPTAAGVCTTLPATIDFDGDGIANHLDLDADGDGLLDAIEGGGEAEADGTIVGFDDLNGNGLSDGLESAPLALPNTDMLAGPDFLDLDSDGDGMTDTFEGGGVDANGDGRPDAGTDANDDGVLDELVGAGQLPTPDTNDDGAPDYQDLDSDGDGIVDAIEGTDTNHDGAAEITPSGMDADNDGLDNAFDPDCTTAMPCGTAVGAVPSTPDFDMDGIDDFRDLDSDGDGITDSVECGEADACVDTDEDGEPDYLDLDADDDSIPDSAEGFDANHDGMPDTSPSGEDTDGDGLDDAFDTDCALAADCGGVIGEAAPLPDLDMDAAPDYQDSDDDEDGIDTSVEVEDGDAYEGPAADGNDVDDDGLPNWYDTDSDGDGFSDMSEESRPDEDGDLDDNDILDYLDPNFAPNDTDGDGVPDLVECPRSAGMDCPDTDGDGSPDFDDVDDDNDGIPTGEEQLAGPDSDEDGIPNRLDLDSDNDGITDLREQNPGDVDANNDGVIDAARDADGDGVDAAFDSNDGDPTRGFADGDIARDTDDDGMMDAVDLDSDADGLFDLVEGNATTARGSLSYDTDRDGIVDGDADADEDGILDAVDGANRLPVPDTDDDGTADFQDVDDDGDSVRTRFEAPDADGNGYPNDARDSDRDGTPDYLDVDDDGDGIHTRFEAPDPNRDGDPRDARNTNVGGPDADTVPDYLDVDDDGDGIDTEDEQPDPNGNNDPADAVDTDRDGTPDYLDPDRADGPRTGGLSGGACGCTVNNTRSNSGFLAMLGVLALVVVRRRRAA